MLLVNPSPSLSRWGGGWDTRPGIGGFFGQDFHPPTPKMEVFWWEKGIQEVKTGEFSSKWLRRRWKRSWKQHRRSFFPPKKSSNLGFSGSRENSRIPRIARGTRWDFGMPCAGPGVGMFLGIFKRFLRISERFPWIDGIRSQTRDLCGY